MLMQKYAKALISALASLKGTFLKIYLIRGENEKFDKLNNNIFEERKFSQMWIADSKNTICK